MVEFNVKIYVKNNLFITIIISSSIGMIIPHIWENAKNGNQTPTSHELIYKKSIRNMDG